MIEALILLGWGFVLAAAWGLAGYRSTVAAETRERLAREAAARSDDAREKARQTVAAVLAEWEHLHREPYRSLDDLLRALPKEWGKGPPYFRMMEAGRFDAAAHYLCSEPTTAATFTALDFEAVEFRLNGKRHSGWRRGGWVLMPDTLC